MVRLPAATIVAQRATLKAALFIRTGTKRDAIFLILELQCDVARNYDMSLVLCYGAVPTCYRAGMVADRGSPQASRGARPMGRDCTL